MKKFLGLLTIILFLPILVLADGVEKYYINATIESNGDLLVEEYFTLSGSYNGFERKINFTNPSAATFNPNAQVFGGSTIHNGNGLEILKIGSANTSFSGNFNSLDIDTFNEDEDASKGDYGVYTSSSNYKGKNVLIYNPSRKHKAFYLKYRLKNMAILFNDVGEVGWNAVGSEFVEDIDYLNITLNIPGNTNDLRAWAHGPLNGLIKIDNQEKVTFTITNLSSYTAIDIRSTFNPRVINSSTKKYNINALDKILAYEEIKAEEANEQRRQNEALNQQTASIYLNNFKNDITRENYNKAYNAIYILMDGDIKTSYIEELAIYKEKLDTIEEEYAKKTLDTLEKKLTMDNYNNASAAVNILDNETIKMEYQTRLDNLYKLLKQKEQRDNNIRLGVSLGLIGFLIYLCTVIYKKYKKDPEVPFNNEYLREIPDDATPEDVSYLFNRDISEKAMSATIMDLIRRKVITQEKIDNKNYNLILNSDKSDLSTKESYLVDLIFNHQGSITTKEMKRNARTNYKSVTKYYDDYKRVALEDAMARNYYETNVKNTGKNSNTFWIVLSVGFFICCFFPPLFIVGFLLLIGYAIYKYLKSFTEDMEKALITSSLLGLGIISLVMSIYILVANLMYKSAIFGYLVLLLAIIIVSIWYAIPVKKTYEGTLAYKKWKALEKFLKEFGSFADKEVPEITLWEKYLVFATLFGCAKEVSKVMDMKFQEYNMATPDYYDSWMTNYYINEMISNSVRTSVASAQSAKYASESSSSSSGSWSSGSGGGGGFSSGGGSFGGGGGGGRF